MVCWSAENATKAFLKPMNMGKRATEPNGAEFISALAAGNSAQIIVVACANVADSTTLALNYEEILGSLRKSVREKSNMVLGYNAFCKDSWRSSPLRTQLLPIGEGLLLTRIAAKAKKGADRGTENRGHWIVKVEMHRGRTCIQSKITLKESD
ncbi:hypothetical protein K7X08_035105 [Anisodus acutangulus]|uniref:Uncharacterized protein n=1 Tax=Anisodus acutangulus TaxID=402998 RepID=A0A9Q1LKI1_9SOLA|nr:hypothetical protein K7X08_035105 [Anisodus acutangulus]